MSSETSILQKRITQLQSVNPEDRFNAVVKLARMPAHDDWKLAYDAIDAMLNAGEPDRDVGRAAAIALSMLAARNIPSHLFYGGPIPDFLPDTLTNAELGLFNQPSPQDFDRLREAWEKLMGGLDDPAG